jgi:cobalamin biosynthesis protein CobT
MATATELRLTKTQAVALLVACGLKAADKFSLPELQKRVNGLVDIEDQIDKKGVKKADPDMFKLLKQVLAASDNDDLVIVTDDKAKGDKKDKKADKPAKGKADKPADDDEDDDSGDDTDEDTDDESDDDSESEEDEDDSEDESDDEGDDSDTEDEDEEVTATKTKKADKKTKDAKAKGKPEKADKKAAVKADKPKEKKEPVGVDKWGCRLGTRAARLNAVISATPKSAAEIKEEAEYDQPINGHLRFLLLKGFIVKTDENKYRTKPTGDKKDKKKGK